MNQNDKQAYLEQIDKYYRKNLSSHLLIELGSTPPILQAYGAPVLPMVMQQSTLTKCIRQNTGSRSAHNLPRKVIESLPEQIENPIFLIQDKSRNSIALITNEIDRDRKPILVAIKFDEKRKEIQVNEVKSVYGKTNLKLYLEKNLALNQLNVIDNKMAERISRVLGLQLSTTLISSNHNKTLSPPNEKVNQKNSVLDKLENYKKQSALHNENQPDKQEKHPERDITY